MFRQRDPLEDFRTRGAQRLGDVMKGVGRQLGLNRRKHDSKLRQLWDEIVGPEAARHTMAVRVKRNALLVTVDSSVWKQEIGTLRKADILSRLETMNTGQFIRELKVDIA